MKDKFRLGQKVFVKRLLGRNGCKPNYDFSDKTRYRLFDCNKYGYICGKSSIHIKGFTEYDEGMYFVPLQTKSVYLVAINMRERIYVDAEDMEIVELDIDVVVNALDKVKEILGANHGTKEISE
jgi:hypothetical protein